MMDNSISILDTTLRDGEQSLSNGLRPSDKPKVAILLSDLGVNVLEVGFPTASSQEYDAIREISTLSLDPTLSVMTRATIRDIDISFSSIKHASNSRLNVLFPVSDIHLAKKLSISRQEALILLDSVFSYASSLPCEVQFTAEDATRANYEFLVDCIGLAFRYGIRHISLPDTLGISLPESYSTLFRQILSDFSSQDLILSAHCHNDLGLATANTLSAISAGAKQVELTICGVGERAGNASLEQVVTCLTIKNNLYPYSHDIRISKLYQSVHDISSLLNYSIPCHTPIVGEFVYSTRAGIHQQGLLKSSSTYQGFDQSMFGAPQLEIVIGKHSGKASIISVLEKSGISPDPLFLDDLLFLVKEKSYSTKSGNITDKDLLDIYHSLLLES